MSTEQTTPTMNLESRVSGSKIFLREARKNGFVPGVLYHKGQSAAIAVALSQLPKVHPKTQVLKVLHNGTEKEVLMREVQTNPLTKAPVHIDFQEVSPTDKVRVHVPLNFVGLTREQEKEGTFSIRMRYLEVVTKLSTLPKAIDVNVSHLKGGESVQLFDLNLGKDLVVKTGKGKNVALASIVKVV